MRDDTGETEPAAPERTSALVRWTSGDVLLLAVATLLAAGLRLWSIEQWSFDTAEAGTWRAVSEPLDAFYASETAFSPLFHLFLRWLIDTGVLPGVTEGWLRLPSAFAATVAVPLVAVLARPVLGRGGALLAAFAFAVHPLAVLFGQSATPVAFAIALALASGASAVRGLRGLSVLFWLLAGGCHWTGWFAGAGWWFVRAQSGSRFGGLWRWSWLVLLLSAVLVLPRLWVDAGPSLLLLAGVGLWMRPPAANGLALAIALPLLPGAAWWWRGQQVATAAIAAASPALLFAACWALVQFARTVVERMQPRSWVRLLASAPAVVLLGELATGTFLYFAVMRGGRPDWRAVQRAAIARTAPGEALRLYAGRGLDVLRTYLRVNHWRQVEPDPHPGIQVEPLPGDAAATEVLMAPGVLLALDPDEYRQLRARPDLLQAFRTVGIWARPRRYGDASLYLLQR